MKHFVLAVGLLLAGLPALAQTDVPFKAAGGHSTLEVSPLALRDTGLALSPLLRYRYFLTDRLAVRLSGTFSRKTNKVKSTGSTFGTTYDITTSITRTSLDLRPGLEYHLPGNERVSPYLGAEFIFASRNSRAKQEYIETGGGGYNYSATITGATSADGDNPSTLSLGGALVAGADVYIIPQAYLGFEAGLGFISTSYRKIKIEEEGVNTIEIDPNRTDTELSLIPTATLRLGFRF